MVTAWIVGLIAAFLANAIDKKSMNAYFNQIHTGANIEWATSLHEEATGRHALRVVR
jgi:hypothetical protein